MKNTRMLNGVALKRKLARLEMPDQEFINNMIARKHAIQRVIIESCTHKRKKGAKCCDECWEKVTDCDLNLRYVEQYEKEHSGV